MATGKIVRTSNFIEKSVTKTNGIAVSSSDLKYIYNPTTMDGILIGRITTNTALSANTSTNLIQISDSLRPYFPNGLYANTTGIPVTLHNVNQNKLHRGYYNSDRQLRYEDSQSISGAVVFEIYLPIHLVQT